MTEFGRGLSLSETPIPGLLLADLTVHPDARGWFKENWQREKMTALGMPDFGPVQNNISYNDTVGTTRGIHAEPWDKWVSVAAGRIFGAWVDLREGPSFGTVFAVEVDPGVAVFVPRGVGNAFQTLEPGTVYTYLVNDHWSPQAQYSFLNLADETAAISWPIPLAEAEVSEKDRAHPRLADVTPLAPRRILVLGADGQVGRALRAAYAGAAHVEFASRADLDLTAPGLRDARRWRDYAAIVNAAAYTTVDAAETADGRRAAWEVNAHGPAALAALGAEFGITIVHFSSEYVFDGTATEAYDEEAQVSPLGVYAQSKAAGDLAVTAAPRHIVLRTSWIIGEGRNFVDIMADLAARGIDPDVVDDQHGRLTFASDLARAVRHALEEGIPSGIYDVTSSGEVVSWADVARAVFTLTGHDPSRVNPVTSEQYTSSRPGPVAPRPAYGALDLAKITATGFTPGDQAERLREHLAVRGLLAS